jgi:hypothetical protein
LERRELKLALVLGQSTNECTKLQSPNVLLSQSRAGSLKCSPRSRIGTKQGSRPCALKVYGYGSDGDGPSKVLTIRALVKWTSRLAGTSEVVARGDHHRLVSVTSMQRWGIQQPAQLPQIDTQLIQSGCRTQPRSPHCEYSRPASSVAGNRAKVRPALQRTAQGSNHLRCVASQG